MKKGSIGWTIYTILEILGLITLGVLSIVFNSNHDLWKVAFIIAGIAFIVDAALHLIFGVVKVITSKDTITIRTSYGTAIGASFELAAGIVLITIGNNLASAEAIFKFVSIFIGVLLITVGSVCLIEGIIFIAKKIGTPFSNSLVLSIGVIGIVAGILALIYLTNGDNIMRTFFIIIGLLLLVGAVLLTIMLIGVLSENKKKSKKKDKKEKDQVVAIEKEDKAEEKEEQKEEALLIEGEVQE